MKLESRTRKPSLPKVKAPQRNINYTSACPTKSSLHSAWSRIGLTGFTNSSGINHLVQLLAESSGFKHLSMDSHSDKSYCDNEKFLFVHSTLPVSIINCQISELVIILRNPEHIIRSEFLQLVTLNSLDHIKEHWPAFQRRYAYLWKNFIHRWSMAYCDKPKFLCFDALMEKPFTELNKVFTELKIDEIWKLRIQCIKKATLMKLKENSIAAHYREFLSFDLESKRVIADANQMMIGSSFSDYSGCLDEKF